MTRKNEWVATLRVEHTGTASGTMGRPGSGCSVLVMEAVDGSMWTQDEWVRGVAANATKYRRDSRGRILSHGSPLQGFEYGPDENPCEWGRW